MIKYKQFNILEYIKDLDIIQTYIDESKLKNSY